MIKNTIEEERPIDLDKEREFPNIEIRDLFKIYKNGNNKVVALKNIQLEIFPGEIVLIMGPSGSGKTTLLNCISGIDKFDAGEILLFGKKTSDITDKTRKFLLKKYIGIVFQFFNLVPNLTARGNIEMPLIIADHSLKETRLRSKQLIEQLGLAERAYHRPNSLSGGERQRVAIGMALANDPKIILADEPTANVDIENANKICDLLTSFISSNPDKSLIIVSHNQELQKLAHKIVFLKNGEIIYQINSQKAISGNVLDKDLNIDQISNCPKCNSTEIITKINLNSNSFIFEGKKMFAYSSIYCSMCRDISLKLIPIN